ncbi:ABC transporter ATP-binding protein [Jonesia quinghaiensis]|uniref:ABC transporter ATP-binding protein n=1 Tax=Jonesia quinghaiensis TaxID=262806 RepID=UPI00040F330E|nr:ABC transporter ATP-binding protein [Jonesia quinghaiensis]
MTTVPPPVEPGRSAPAPTLSATGLTVAYDALTVIDSLDVTIPPGQVTAIVGANACGKSTLLKALSRLHQPVRGTVHLDGQDITSIARKRLAQVLAVLPQQPTAPDGVTVADLVSRGRHPHRSLFGRWSPADEAAVTQALALTDTTELAHRPLSELSGGQRQRVWIAMVLAQDPHVMLLDEPTTFLDLHHQIEVLDLLAHLNTTRGTTIVMVLHELNLAARYADHLIVMAGGRIIAQGDPQTTLTSSIVKQAFTLDALVIKDPVTGTPLVVPERPSHGTTRHRDTTPHTPETASQPGATQKELP